MTYGTAKIIENSMEQWMLQECVDCAVYALHNFKDEEEVSHFIKTELDLKYEPSWHVIVGQSYGAFIGYDIKLCSHFAVGSMYFLIFKSPEPEVAYIPEEEDTEASETEALSVEGGETPAEALETNEENPREEGK